MVQTTLLALAPSRKCTWVPGRPAGWGPENRGQLDVARLPLGNIGLRCRADVNLAGGELRQQVLAQGEGVALFGDDNRGIRRQRVGVHGGDKDGGRVAVGGRHLAVGPGAQRGPLGAVHQLPANGSGVQRPGRVGAVAVKIFEFVAVQVDDHRLQHALGAAVDRRDHSTAGRGVANTRRFLVGEQQLATLDAVALLYFHSGLHPHIVEAHQRHGARRGRVVYHLLGSSQDWNVHAPLDLDHTICLQIRKICGWAEAVSRAKTLLGAQQAHAGTRTARIIADCLHQTPHGAPEFFDSEQVLLDSIYPGDRGALAAAALYQPTPLADIRRSGCPPFSRECDAPGSCNRIHCRTTGTALPACR